MLSNYDHGGKVHWQANIFRAVNSSAIARGRSAGSNSTSKTEKAQRKEKKKNREQYNDLFKTLVVKVRSISGSEHYSQTQQMHQDTN